MSYTQDYYAILNLPAPLPASSQPLSTADLRRAYKLALLSAHPDKQHSSSSSGSAISGGGGGGSVYTIDQVKEAYSVLSNARRKGEYDNFLVRNPEVLQRSRNGNGASGASGASQDVISSDFILGLELLDLSDFDVLDPGFRFSEAEPSALASESHAAGSGAIGSEAAEGQMEWTRACRCGDEKGFRILEEELEDAEGRGEKEVLVGCEGCSLWVRVGFEVEVE